MEKAQFEAALKSFVEGCQRIHTDHQARAYPNVTPGTITAAAGRRYVKIVRLVVGQGRSVHCFVDTTNGDVLKAAGWKAPAKHARGNIFDASNGLGWMGEYGPAYLR